MILGNLVSELECLRGELIKSSSKFNFSRITNDHFDLIDLASMELKSKTLGFVQKIAFSLDELDPWIANTRGFINGKDAVPKGKFHWNNAFYHEKLGWFWWDYGQLIGILANLFLPKLIRTDTMFYGPTAVLSFLEKIGGYKVMERLDLEYKSRYLNPSQKTELETSIVPEGYILK